MTYVIRWKRLKNFFVPISSNSNIYKLDILEPLFSLFRCFILLVSEMNVFVVAVVVSEKKEQELFSRGLFAWSATDPVHYIPTRSVDGINHPSVDFVLSKVYPEMPDDILGALHAVSPSQHAVCLETQKVFSDRWSVIEYLWEGERTLAPDSALIGSWDDGLVDAFLIEHENVILKTRAAFGHQETHTMCIASSLKTVREFVNRMKGREIIIQQLIPHDGWFAKVFVIGDDVSVYMRRSIDTHQLEDGTEVDSQRLPRGAETIAVPDAIRLEVKQIAVEIRTLFKTDLLGFDVVLDSSCGKLIIVDVNFFPSFKELGPEFKTRLDLFCSAHSR